MDHEARMDLARSVTEILLRRHPNVVAVAIVGSTAKGEDREHSDLEMCAYTEGTPDTRAYSLVHRDIVVEVALEPREKALEEAGRADAWWPVSADGWVHPLPLHDPEGLLPRLADAASRPGPERVAVALNAAFTAVYEDLCKMRNHLASGEEAMARFAAPFCALNVANYVALLNGQHYNGTRNLLTKPREFEELPPHFWEDFPPLLAVDAPTDALMGHAERLHQECRAMWPFPERAPWAVEDLEAALELGRIPRD